ncbi:hypothetical protein ABPG75_006958 [Micractinium tetrahymenae]
MQTCLHRGEPYVLDGLPSQRHADQAADLLSIKATLDEGQPVERLVLRSRAQPLSAGELTEAGRRESAGLTFQKLFTQINGWTEELRDGQAAACLAPAAAAAGPCGSQDSQRSLPRGIPAVGSLP